MAITLNGNQIPNTRDFSQALLKNGLHNSVFRTLCSATPVVMGETGIPIYNSEFNLGVVGEGQRKPVSQGAVTMKYLRPVKVAGILVLSDELVKRNPGGVVQQIVEQDLPNGIERMLDVIGLSGKDPLTGARVSAQGDAVLDTPNRVSASAGVSTSDSLTALVTAAQATGGEVNGFALNTNQKINVAAMQQGLLVATPNGVQSQGLNLASAVSTVFGVPAAFSPRVDALAVAGDWSQVRWGLGEDVSIEESTQSTIVEADGTVVSLWQNNLRAFRVETTVAFAVLDGGKFAVLEGK